MCSECTQRETLNDCLYLCSRWLLGLRANSQVRGDGRHRARHGRWYVFGSLSLSFSLTHTQQQHNLRVLLMRRRHERARVRDAVRRGGRERQEAATGGRAGAEQEPVRARHDGPLYRREP